MNEQANVQVVRAAYAAFRRGDIASLLSSLGENVTWVAAEIEPVAGTYRGRAEVGEFFRKVNDIVDYSSFEPEEFVAQGDRVIVLGSYRGKAKATGRFYECDWAMAFTVEHGQITEFQEFTDTAVVKAALDASPASASAAGGAR
jgi:ketosteroid isomerase-like protein